MVVALGIGAGFVAVGVGWAAVESEIGDRDEVCGPIAYVHSAMTCGEPTIWLVDGYNVLHAAVLGGKDPLSGGPDLDAANCSSGPLASMPTPRSGSSSMDRTIPEP
jgi:hypothetical protein